MDMSTQIYLLQCLLICYMSSQSSQTFPRPQALDKALACFGVRTVIL